MHHLNLFAATTATTVTSMFDTLAHFIGSGIIFVSVIWSAYCLITYLIKRLSPVALPAITPASVAPKLAAPTLAAPTLAASGPVATAAPAIPPQTVAVIAAAVHYMLGDKHKIIAIKPQDTSWEKAGRQAVLSSHRIR
ncbi:MAG: hypothetical protein WCO57_00460 [Verrucomicrobiota bacterium]